MEQLACTVGRQGLKLRWMKIPREKAAKWREYKYCRRVFGRKHEIAIAALGILAE